MVLIMFLGVIFNCLFLLSPTICTNELYTILYSCFICCAASNNIGSYIFLISFQASYMRLVKCDLPRPLAFQSGRAVHHQWDWVVQRHQPTLLLLKYNYK